MSSPRAFAPSTLALIALLTSACGGGEETVLEESSPSAISPRVPPEARSSLGIASLTTDGSGCPPGSVVANLAEDGAEFTLIFNALYATTGPSEPPEASRASCRIVVTLDAPRGWSHAIGNVDARGFVQLDEGVIATQTVGHGFADAPEGPPETTTFTGPVEQDYLVSRAVRFADMRWSRCGARHPVKLETTLRVRNRQNHQGSGLITTDSIDGEVQQVFRLAWRSCSP